MVVSLFEKLGLGLMMAINVNGLPVQPRAMGVTVYVACATLLVVSINNCVILCAGALFADAPSIELAGLMTGKSQVYKVEILVKLLVGDEENAASLQAICEAVETLGSGRTVTSKLNGLPTQLPLFGVIV